MTWTEKIVQQLKRLRPDADISNDATEAEIVNSLENLKPASEILENSDKLNDLFSRVEKLEEMNSDTAETVSKESYDATVKSLTNQIASLKTSNEALEAQLVSVKKDLSAEIGSLKLKPSVENNGADKVPGLKDEVVDDKDNLNVNFKDLFSGNVIPGIMS